MQLHLLVLISKLLSHCISRDRGTIPIGECDFFRKIHLDRFIHYIAKKKKRGGDEHK